MNDKSRARWGAKKNLRILIPRLVHFKRRLSFYGLDGFRAAPMISDQKSTSVLVKARRGQ
jgi:hypothetical protein